MTTTTSRRLGARSRWRAWLVAGIFVSAQAVLPESAPAQEPAGAPEPTGAIAVPDPAATDAAIEERLGDILTEIEGFDGITVEVSEGVVTTTGEVAEGARIGELDEIVARIEGVVAHENEVLETTDVVARLNPVIDRMIGRTEALLLQTPLFVIAVVAFLLIYAIGGWISRRQGLWDRLAPNAFIADIYRMIARVVFIVLGLVVALDILGLTALIGATLGAAGVVGLAVGFAVRDTVENFIASILLSLRQPFRPNDFVEIEGHQGSVARLTSRATILISVEGNHIRIPNATVFKAQIINYTRAKERRFSFVLGVDAESDLAAALQTGIDAMKGLDFTMSDPAPEGWTEEVGDSNVVLNFGAWVDQSAYHFLKARGQAIRAVKTALEDAGFGLPEPIYRLKIDDMEKAAALADRAAEPDDMAPRGATVTERPAEDLSRSPDAPKKTEDPIARAVDRERHEGEEEDLLGGSGKME